MRRVNQSARIVRAHLEQDAHFEFADRLAVEHPIQIVQAITPGHHMDPHPWAVLENRSKLLRGIWLLFLAREAKIVVGFPQFAESGEIVDHQENRWLRSQV